MYLFFLILVSSRLLAVEGREVERQVQFVDVAEEVGVVAQNVSGDSEQTYLVDSMMGGSAFFDYDQDGDLDLYILNGSKVVGFPDQEHPRNTFYRNEHGTFVDATDEANLGDAGWGMGCAVGDYDNDGDLDIYITNYGRNVLYDNQGDGTFVDVTEYAQVGDERFSTGCAFLDYDGDGYLDLYVANYVDFKHFLQTTPNRSYIWKGLRVHFGPRGMKGGGDILYRNQGDGTFADVTAETRVVDQDKLYGMGVIGGDYDRDGDVDIYVAIALVLIKGAVRHGMRLPRLRRRRISRSVRSQLRRFQALSADHSQ